MEKTTKLWLAALALAVVLQLGFAALFGVWKPPAPVSFSMSVAAVVGLVLVTSALAPVPSITLVVLGLIPLSALFAIGIRGSPASDQIMGATVLVSLLSLGTAGGAFVGNRVARPGWLFVVAYATSVVDLYSVFSASGPTAHVVESEMLLSVLAIGWPTPAGPEIAPLLGVGDVLMTSVYLVAVRKHALGVRRCLIALAGAYCVTFATAVAIGLPLPALPFLGVAVLLAHPEARKVPAEDRQTAFAGLAVLTIVFGALWFVAS